MGAKTGIEWTDSTWNPIRARRNKLDSFGNGGLKVGWHCEHVSEGCRNCYAETMNRRLGTGLNFRPGHRPEIETFLDEKMLLAPLRWKTPRRIFVNSMTDTFAEFITDEMLDRIFATMGECEERGLGHEFQVLTKRHERMRQYIATRAHEAWNRSRMGPDAFPPRNVWIGVSAEDQATADERIPLLLATPAAVRFVSLEPLLGPIKIADAIMPWALDEVRRRIVDNKKPHPRDGKLDWVIVGGESGAGARPMHPGWPRSLRDQCAAAGVPFFFKQHGEWLCELGSGNHRAKPGDLVSLGDGHIARRVGKKSAGRLLDGREHNGMPSALRETAQSAVQPTEPS